MSPQSLQRKIPLWQQLATHGGVIGGMFLLTLIYLRPIGRFTSGLYGLDDDRWMNVFHIWWMREAFTQGLWPWHTPFLYHPTGADMYWHTLAPAKHVWGIVLLPFMSAVTASNVLVVFTFVLSGYSAWLLCRYVAEKVAGTGIATNIAAFIGACVFALSPYHTAHALGHMNLISIEGIPLFILCYLRYKKEGKWAWLVGIGITSLYIILSEYYFIVYVSVFVLLDYGYEMFIERNITVKEMVRDTTVRRITSALMSMAIFCSPVLLLLLLHAFPPPFNFYHTDSDYYADIKGLLFPNSTSLWYEILPSFAKFRSPNNPLEDGVFLGWCTTMIALYAVWKNIYQARRFAVIGTTFLVLSLGSFLAFGGTTALRIYTICLILLPIHICFYIIYKKKFLKYIACVLVLVAIIDLVYPFTHAGRITAIQIPLPYLIFKHVFPFFERGGCPIRFLLMTYLVLGMCVSMSIAWLVQKRVLKVTKYEALLLLALLPLLEYGTNRHPMTPIRFLPPHVINIIQQSPPDAAILTDNSVLREFEVTLHERPVSMARLSRVPALEYQEHQRLLFRIIEGNESPVIDTKQRLQILEDVRKFNFKYVIVHQPSFEKSSFIVDVLGGKLLSAQSEIYVYSLGNE